MPLPWFFCFWFCLCFCYASFFVLVWLQYEKKERNCRPRVDSISISGDAVADAPLVKSAYLRHPLLYGLPTPPSPSLPPSSSRSEIRKISLSVSLFLPSRWFRTVFTPHIHTHISRCPGDAAPNSESEKFPSGGSRIRLLSHPGRQTL